MSRVLVTGANGYIGKHVVTEFLNQGHEVFALDLYNEFVDPRAHFINYDLFNMSENTSKDLIIPDILVHMAWRNGFVHNSPTHMLDLSAHFNFLKLMIDKGVKNIAVMGSMHEIGYWEGPIDENTPCKPLSQYGIAKNALRQSVTLLAKESGLNLYWLRGYYIFGDDSRGSSIFAKITQAVKEGKKEFPFTTGKNKYDFITVYDLARQIVSASTQKEITGIINVCTGKPVSLADQVGHYIKERGFDIKLIYGAFPDRPYDSPGVWGNAEKINKIMELVKK